MFAHRLKLVVVFVFLCSVIFFALMINGNTVYTHGTILQVTEPRVSPSPMPFPITPSLAPSFTPSYTPTQVASPTATSTTPGSTAQPPATEFIQPTAVDSDGDGIPDAQDRCPTVPGPDTVDGCLYRDAGSYAVVARQVSEGNNLIDRLDGFKITNGSLYHIVWENHQAEWNLMPGNWTGEPVAVETTTGSIEVFATDLNSRLHSTVLEDGEWSEWDEVPDAIANSTPAIVISDNRLDLFVVGTDGDIWHNWRMDDSWQNWHSLELTRLGVTAASVPVAVMPSPDELFVFVRDSDSLLQYSTGNNATWSQWSEIRNGRLKAAPAVLVPAPDQVDVFVTGLESTLWHIAWDGQEWSDEWHELDTDWVIASSPSAALGPDDNLSVFMQARVGTSGQPMLAYAVWNGERWSANESWEGIITAGPVAFAWPDAVGAVVRGTSDELWLRWQDARLQPWESLMPPAP